MTSPYLDRATQRLCPVLARYCREPLRLVRPRQCNPASATGRCYCSSVTIHHPEAARAAELLGFVSDPVYDPVAIVAK